MKKIIIIGGGFAGAHAARKLERDFEVTLIDIKDYFEFTPSVLRTLVEPEHIEKIQVLHRAYLKEAHVIKGDVTNINEHAVFIGKEKHPYDYLLIASGSRYNMPIKEKGMVITTRAKELQKYAEKLQKAKNVLIVGGGVVGTELAGEIIDRYPEKNVTIVHAKESLLERNPPKARKYAERFLRGWGVQILFGEKVVGHKGKLYETNKGETISTDLAFLCTGIEPNYEYLQTHCSTNLNLRHYLCVNEFLQVEGKKNIFAAGDINNVAEEKTAQSAEKQAEIVGKNIKALEAGGDLVTYAAAPKVMVISLGKWRGILVYKKFVWTGIVPGILKWLIEWKTMRRYRQ